MAREQVDQGKLRGCPTCSTPVSDAKLALRDFGWVNAALPGKIGGMDLDFVLSCARTNRTLILEMKPSGAFVSMGARLTFKSFVQMGCDIWVVYGPGAKGKVELAHVMANGQLTGRVEMHLDELAALVAQWWQAAQVMPEDA